MEAELWLVKRVYFFDSPGSYKDNVDVPELVVVIELGVFVESK